MLNRQQRETESVLLSLEPAEPSDKLQQRIRGLYFEHRREKRRIARPLAWFGAGSMLAASVGLLFYVNFGQKEAPLIEVKALEESVLSIPYKGLGEFKRIRVSSRLVGIDKGPIFIDEEGVPVRVTNLRYFDTEVLKRANDGKEVTVESIREEMSTTRAVSF